MSLGFDSQQDPKPWPCLEQLAPLFPLLLSIWSLLSFCFGHFCTSHSSPSPVPCPPGTLLRGHVAGRGGLAAARPRRKPAPLSHAWVLLAAATMLNCICASGKKKKSHAVSRTGFKKDYTSIPSHPAHPHPPPPLFSPRRSSDFDDDHWQSFKTMYYKIFKKKKKSSCHNVMQIFVTAPRLLLSISSEGERLGRSQMETSSHPRSVGPQAKSLEFVPYCLKAKLREEIAEEREWEQQEVPAPGQMGTSQGCALGPPPQARVAAPLRRPAQPT